MATAWRNGVVWWRHHPTAADLILAVAFSIAALVSLFTTFELLQQDPSWEAPDKGPIVLSLLAVTLPLAVRRRYPLLVAAVVTAAFVAGRMLVNPGIPGVAAWEATVTVWALWVAMYTAVVHGPERRETAIVVAAVVVVLLAEIVREIMFYEGGSFNDLPLNQGFLLAYNLVSVALPIALGLAVRGLRRRQVALTDQAAELRRQREENARRAVLDERVRIARELHDVVAHHVSVMGIQAGAARSVMRTQPERAEEALSSVESSSRQAVVELHHLLGFLRRDDQQDGLSPQPDLSRLSELVADAGGGGDALQVRLQIEGEPRPLPSTLELSAYRVIQEALTNTRKHADATTSTVRVAYRPTMLEIEVLDDGRGGAAAANGGHGLIGMRERVGLHGGHLRAGSRPEGGFAVYATFPVDAGASVTIRVVLVDDQDLVRVGFRMILGAEDDITIVGEASDGEQAIDVTRRSQPDVVLMDVQMPRLDGLEATRRLGDDPGIDTRVVILTTFEQDEYVFEALRAGASGFLLKNSRPEELVHAVRVVASGDALLSPAITRRVIHDYVRRPGRPKDDPALDRLTEREVEVLRLLATGKSNAELAAEMFLGEGTVKTHVSHLLSKLGLRDRVQAVVFAYESGLVERGDR